jgi:hypothetical protein
MELLVRESRSGSDESGVYIRWKGQVLVVMILLLLLRHWSHSGWVLFHHSRDIDTHDLYNPTRVPLQSALVRASNGNIAWYDAGYQVPKPSQTDTLTLATWHESIVLVT